MAPTRVFVDANVLYSRTLRDWLALLQLRSSGDVYTVYWTEDVLAETIYRLRRSHPEWNGAKITRIRDLIAATFEGGRVEEFSIDDSFPGSDGDDRHVHAAAVACRADIVLTADKGFLSSGREPDSQPYEAYGPDDFFMLVDDSAAALVRLVTREQTMYWTRRGTRADLAGPLIAAGCPRFAERVRAHQRKLSLPG
ncbi:MAG: PIN domain-containing protein [Saccharothrix sp.]|nr:PIN domain-containing protein [Saccharothrix sp.]